MAPQSITPAMYPASPFRVDEHLRALVELGKVPGPCIICDETTSLVVFFPMGYVGKLVVLNSGSMCESCTQKAVSLRRTKRTLDSEGQEFLVISGLRRVDPSELN